MRFPIFPFHLSKVLRLPRKSDAKSYEVLHLSRKIISANPKIWCSKCNSSQEISALTSTALMNMSLALRLPRENLGHATKPSRFAHFWQGAYSTSQLLKALRSWGVLYILTWKCTTWKCASRHNGVQLFISHLTTWLRTCRFSEPSFRPSGATSHLKNTVFRDFPTFSCTWIVFLLRLSLLWSSLF